MREGFARPRSGGTGEHRERSEQAVPPGDIQSLVMMNSGPISKMSWKWGRRRSAL